MRTHLFGTAAILAASVLAFGCSADSDDDDNGNNKLDCSFEACGGDLVGTWTIKGSCFDTTGGGFEGIPECSDAVASGNPKTTGTVTFKDDGTFTRNMKISGSSRLVVDDDCIAAISMGMLDGETYCAMQGEAQMPGMTADCSYSGGKCTCTNTYDMDLDLPGTYSTAGNKVTLSDRMTPSDYCVSGSQLKLKGDGELQVYEGDGNTGAGGSGGDGGSGGSGGDGGSGGSGGSGSDPLTCDTFDACGGDLVGNWEAYGTCITEGGTAMFVEAAECIEEPFAFSGEMSGSIRYTSSQEFWNLHQSGTGTFTLTDACFALFQLTCEELATEAEALSFEIVGGKCALTFDFTGDLQATYDYEIVGTNLTYPDYVDVIPFCVDGDFMGQAWSGFSILFEKG